MPDPAAPDPDDKWTFGLADDEDYPPEPKMISPEFRAIAEASAKAPAVRCPDCGYDLRGNRSGVCPECGLKLTSAALRRAARKRDRKASDSPYFVSGVVLGVSVVAGLGLNALLWGIDGGVNGAVVGAVVYLAWLAVLVVTGWVVFFACSAMWIGWSQTIPVTIVQITAAYAAYATISTVLGMTGIPIMPWLISMGCLLGLQCKLLDIEFRDALIITFVSGALKTLLGLVVLSAIIIALGG